MGFARFATRIVDAGLVGALVFLFINTSANLMQACGPDGRNSETFITWAGGRLHDRVREFGDALGRRRHVGAYGEDRYTMLRSWRKVPYWLGPGMLLGFAAGGGVGLVLAARDLRRRQSVDTGQVREIVLPASWPLAIAFAGVLFHGHLLGLAAVLLSGHTRRRAWLVWLTRVIGAGVVLLWAVGTELWWGHRWSEEYPAIARFLLRLFG